MGQTELTALIRVILCAGWLLLSHFHAVAQWLDRFDGDLRSWSGDTSHFRITTEGRLALQAPAAGSSFIHRPYRYDSGDQRWTLWCRLDFAPSATNRLRFWLAMDRTDPASAEGYYIDIGENGSEDNWKLYARQGNRTVLLGQGVKVRLAGDPAECYFEISRQSDSSWTVGTDYSAGRNPLTESVLTDSLRLPISDAWLGIQCVYTDTRRDKFSFDDAGVSPPGRDTLAPHIIRADVIGNNKLRIQFDEPPTETTVSDTLNYFVPGIGHPFGSDPDTSNQSRILNFGKPFGLASTYTLRYTGLADSLGNSLSGLDSILFRTEDARAPRPGELLITEFLADPSPSVGLPEVEFVEIYNQSSDPLNLGGLRLGDASGLSAIFPESVLPAGSYLILCPLVDSLAYRAYGAVLGIQSFPALNNGGDEIRIVASDGSLMELLTFDLSWYDVSSKKDGGYSLELIRINQSCQGAASWATSGDPLGGTPGRANSRIDTTQDVTGPRLTDALAISIWEIRLIFDEAPDEALARELWRYTLDNGITLATADPDPSSARAWILVLNQPLQPGVEYRLRIGGLTDCLGNRSDTLRAVLSLPAEPSEGDILFNEVLFNPVTGGSDFIELYNTSPSSILLRGLFLANPSKSPIPVRITLDKILAPGDYLVLTPDPDQIIAQYPSGDSSRIFQADLPSIDDEGGSLVLSYPRAGRQERIDSFGFSKDWHHPLIKDENGVSLEKIRPDLSSGDPDHWQSASGTSGYGTPGRKNSQFLDSLSGPEKRPYHIHDRVVTPNGDGFRDYLSLEFDLDQAGYKIRAEVYDPSGFKVRELSQELVGPTEILSWGGDDDMGQILTSGNYILQIRLIHPEGRYRNYRELVVIDSGR